MTPDQSTLQLRSFRLYLSAIVISYFGNGMHFIAVSWLILELTGSSSQVGLILGLSLLPSLFISMPAGLLADRHNRKYISVATDLIRFATVAAIPVLYFVNGSVFSPMLVLVCELIQACATPFFNTATAALVKECVPPNLLLQANRYKEIAVQSASLIGAGLAGFLIAAVGTYGALLIDAATFLLSALLLSSMKYQKSAASETQRRKQVLALAKEGFAYARAHKEILQAVFFSVTPFLILKSINVILGDFVRMSLHAGAKEFGLVDASFAVGSILGGLTLGYFMKWIGYSRSVVFFYALLTASLFGFSGSTSVLGTMFFFFAVGLGVLSLKIALGTHIQSQTEQAYVGRIHGLTTALQGLVGPIMLGLSGVLADFASPRHVLFVLAIFSAVVGFCAFYVFRTETEIAPVTPGVSQ